MIYRVFLLMNQLWLKFLSNIYKNTLRNFYLDALKYIGALLPANRYPKISKI